MGNMVPAGGGRRRCATRSGPLSINRFNLYPVGRSTGIAGSPGVSVGRGRWPSMERLAADVLPPTMGYQWSGVTYQELAAGNLAPLIFGLAFVFVYLFLVAQYESWMIPLSVLLAVPVAILGAVLLALAPRAWTTTSTPRSGWCC